MSGGVNGHEPAAGVFPAPGEFDEQPVKDGPHADEVSADAGTLGVVTERVSGTALGVVRENGVTMLVLTFSRPEGTGPEGTGPVIIKIGLDERGAIELASLLLINASMKD